MILKLGGAEPYNPIKSVTLITEGIESGEPDVLTFVDPEDVVNIVPDHLVYVLRVYSDASGKSVEVLRKIIPWRRLLMIDLESGDPTEDVWKKVPLGSSSPLYFPDIQPAQVPDTGLN